MQDGQAERRRRIDEPPSEVEDDPVEAVENAEPYFPPTDPVIAPASMSPPASESGGVGDEAIADRVRTALRQDAATAGLELDVSAEAGVVTLRGTVDDLTDVDTALEVAGRVKGVDDVNDELEVAGS